MPKKTRNLDAGPLQGDIDLFELHLMSENKSPKTILTYLSAAKWFAAEGLLPRAGKKVLSWEDVTSKDIQRWIKRLLAEHSDSYANNQYRALQQFFRWYSAEEEVPNVMAGMMPPKIRPHLVPVLSSEELEKLLKTAKGKGFQARRDTAVMSLFRDTGIRLAELAGLGLADVDLRRREATVTGKGGKQRTVRFTAATASALGQYLKERGKHRHHEQPELWLGVRSKGAMTPNGVYQMIKRRGDEAGVEVHPHQFRHTFSHTWLDNGGAEWDLVELNGWESPQMLKIYAKSAASSRARRSYDRIMEGV
jgi:site-specific recombinase XerD